MLLIQASMACLLQSQEHRMRCLISIPSLHLSSICHVACILDAHIPLIRQHLTKMIERFELLQVWHLTAHGRSRHHVGSGQLKAFGPDRYF